MDADERVRAGQIESLAELRAFQWLVDDLEAASERAWASLVGGLKMGVHADQRVIDELRGADKTIRLLKKSPSRAARQLGKAEEAETA